MLTNCSGSFFCKMGRLNKHILTMCLHCLHTATNRRRPPSLQWRTSTVWVVARPGLRRTVLWCGLHHREVCITRWGQRAHDVPWAGISTGFTQVSLPLQRHLCAFPPATVQWEEREIRPSWWEAGQLPSCPDWRQTYMQQARMQHK